MVFMVLWFLSFFLHFHHMFLLHEGIFPLLTNASQVLEDFGQNHSTRLRFGALAGPLGNMHLTNGSGRPFPALPGRGRPWPASPALPGPARPFRALAGAPGPCPALTVPNAH